MTASYVAYGLRLAANMPVPGLSPTIDSNGVDVRIRLKDWSKFPSSFPGLTDIFYISAHVGADGQPNLRAGVFPSGEYFGFFYGDGARFAVDRRGGEVWADWPEGYTVEDASTYLLGPVMGFVLRLRGITCLHASAVVIDDYAFAMAGIPGAGKSTTAAALARSGFPLITEDIVALVEDTESFMVQPGYPRVNLWPDSVRSLFGSEEALPRITPTWDKRYMIVGNGGLGFISKAMPLGAIYILGARDETMTVPVVEEMTGSDAFVALVANSYVNYLLDRDMRRREFDVLSRVVPKIPIRRVLPPADPSALFNLCDAIAADAKQLIEPAPANANSVHG